MEVSLCLVRVMVVDVMKSVGLLVYSYRNLHPGDRALPLHSCVSREGEEV